MDEGRVRLTGPCLAGIEVREAERPPFGAPSDATSSGWSLAARVNPRIHRYATPASVTSAGTGRELLVHP